jgi:hypothetical protein
VPQFLISLLNFGHIHRYVGASHTATSAIQSALKNVSPDTHWIAHHLVTAGSKRIKMRLLGTADTVDNTPSARQQELYLCSVRRPASSQSTRPVSAEPTRALPTSKNFRSTSFTSAPACRQHSAEKLGWLPTCCPLNPACCRPSAPAFGCAQLALFWACSSSSVATFAVHKLPVRLHIRRARTVV